MGVILIDWILPTLGSVKLLGDPPDTAKSCVPSIPDVPELRRGSCQSRFIHGVVTLATPGDRGDQPCSGQHREMLGDSLPGDRNVSAEPGRRACSLRQQQVQEQSARGVSHG